MGRLSFVTAAVSPSAALAAGALAAAAIAASAFAAGTRADDRSSAAASRWIAFHADPQTSGDLYLDSEDGTRRRRLTTILGQIPTAVWSPDGTRFAMLARPTGVVDVYLLGADGHGLLRLTHDEG